MEKAHLGALPISSYSNWTYYTCEPGQNDPTNFIIQQIELTTPNSKLNLLHMRAGTKWHNWFHHTANWTYYKCEPGQNDPYTPREKQKESIYRCLFDVPLLPFFTWVIFQMSKTLGKVRTLFQVLLRLDFSDII